MVRPHLEHARHVVVFTGAGIAAESGVPTFRDAQTGLWARFDPTELATPQAFRRNPKLVWDWYSWRRELVCGAEPNAGHLALVEMQRRVPRFTLITQNIDGLHQRAGSASVIELHGNIHRTKCFDEDVVVDSWPPTSAVPPPCPRCGGHLRPDVVWFGEVLPHASLSAAIDAANDCDAFLSIGTSTQVYPAALLPFTAAERGALVVEINPDVTPLTPRASYSLRGTAAQVLPELVRATWPAGRN